MGLDNCMIWKSPSHPTNGPQNGLLHRMMVLFVASPWKRIVDVPDVLDTVVFEMVSELPPEFRPSIVILSAPLKSIKGRPALTAPSILNAPPDGWMLMDAQLPAPKTAPVAGSVVFPVMVIWMTAPDCEVPMATAAADKEACEPFPVMAPDTFTCALMPVTRIARNMKIQGMVNFMNRTV